MIKFLLQKLLAPFEAAHFAWEELVETRAHVGLDASIKLLEHVSHYGPPRLRLTLLAPKALIVAIHRHHRREPAAIGAFKAWDGLRQYSFALVLEENLATTPLTFLGMQVELHGGDNIIVGEDNLERLVRLGENAST